MYFLTNSDHPSEDSEPQELPPPILVKAEVPTVPRRPVEEDDQVTFDTFKRRPKGQKPDEQQTEKQPTQPKELPPKAATLASIPLPTQSPKPPLKQMLLTNTPTEAYYETVVPIIKSTQADDELAETYDILDHQREGLKGRHFTAPNYSQLNISRSKSPTLVDTDHSYSLVAPRTQRMPSTPPPVPPPLSPSYNGLELLGHRKRFSKDILTSSWSKPSHMDEVTSHNHTSKQAVIPQEEDLYDYPTKKAAAPKLQRARKRGAAVKVTNDGAEVIYDVPPSRKISEDNTSLDSYVDMTQYTITKL